MTAAILVTQAQATLPWRVPTRSYDQDCGYDLYSSEPVLVPAKGHADVPHNIKIELPPDTWGWLTSRSSTLRKLGLVVIGGVIDGGYRGELFTQVYNPTDSAIEVKYDSRISQLIVMPLIVPPVIAVAEISETDRGSKGFGSSNEDPNHEEIPNDPIHDEGDGDPDHGIQSTKRPKIICLCGSTKFHEDFDRINTILTIRGYIVLSVAPSHMPDDSLFAGMREEQRKAVKDRLDVLHQHKIIMSDEILVLNRDGYVGQSTKNEIKLAKNLNKVVRYLCPGLLPTSLASIEEEPSSDNPTN